jgi:predicted transcriptional regulator
MDEERAVLISVRPRYAEVILAQDKTVELRRTRPNVPTGTRVILYSSSPVMAVVGTATLRHLEQSTPADLWDRVGSFSGISRVEFDDYFQGATRGFGLHLAGAARLDSPVTLEELRRDHDLEPAQSFRYLTTAQVLRLVPQASSYATRGSFAEHRVRDSWPRVLNHGDDLGRRVLAPARWA